MLLTKKVFDALFPVTIICIKFTGSSCFNVAETSTLFRSVVYVARRFFATPGEIYDDGQVREFLMWLLKPSTTELYKYNYQFRAVHWYAVTFAKPIYNSSDSVNPLKSLLYAAHHHYTLSPLFIVTGKQIGRAHV